jgi:hypothetical protein
VGNSFIAHITDPIALCAYVLFLIFGLMGRTWAGRTKKDRRLFAVGATLACIVVLGGLLLAWREIEDRGSTVVASAEPATARNLPTRPSVPVASAKVPSGGTARAKALQQSGSVAQISHGAQSICVRSCGGCPIRSAPSSSSRMDQIGSWPGNESHAVQQISVVASPGGSAQLRSPSSRQSHPASRN